MVQYGNYETIISMKSSQYLSRRKTIDGKWDYKSMKQPEKSRV